MRIDVLTLFPEMIAGPLGTSVIGRAKEAGLFELGVHDIRAHGLGKHRTVDDTPYGGGSGMVMRIDVLDPAIAAVRRPDSHVVLFEPSGTRFDQRVAERFAAMPHLVLVCGHYEGIDARVRDHLVDETISIGDYVLTGGEYAALVVVDAAARLLDGVLGNAHSARDESFADGMLEYPHYTRPRSYRGWEIPEILLSGDHGKVDAWRRAQSRLRTAAVRPDLPLPALPEPKKPRRPRTGRVATTEPDVARGGVATTEPDVARGGVATTEPDVSVATTEPDVTRQGKP